VPLGGLLLNSDVFFFSLTVVLNGDLAMAWCVLLLCADKIGPTMAVLRLDVQRNIEVSKQDLLSFSSPGLRLLGVSNRQPFMVADTVDYILLTLVVLVANTTTCNCKAAIRQRVSVIRRPPTCLSYLQKAPLALPDHRRRESKFTIKERRKGCKFGSNCNMKSHLETV